MPTAPGKAIAPVTWSEATSPIGWSDVTTTLEGSMTNGGDYPIGETNLTYNAVDPDGLNDSCTFFIVVFGNSFNIYFSKLLCNDRELGPALTIPQFM